MLCPSYYIYTGCVCSKQKLSRSTLIEGPAVVCAARQLDRALSADAGSWQIADGGDTSVTRAPELPLSASVGDLREFNSSSSPSWSLNRAVLDDRTGANMVSRTKRSARSTRSWSLRYPPWARRQYVG